MQAARSKMSRDAAGMCGGPIGSETSDVAIRRRSIIVKLFYISQGSIPSRWAHTIQQIKMTAALARIGCDVELVTQVHPIHRFRPFDYSAWYGVERGVRVRELPSLRASLRRMQRQVYANGFAKPAVRLAEREGVDLIYTRFHNVLAPALDRGLPIIYETHRPEEDRKFDLLRQVVQREELRAVVTVSAELARRYASWGIPEKKLFVFPDAVDPAQFEPVTALNLRPRLGLPDDAFLALYTGHLYEDKGIGTLIAAAANLPDVAFVLVGGWPEDVERWKKEAPQNVCFTGFVSHAEIPAYLAAADLLLLPNSARFDSAKVTSPLKLFEYMAARRPIVASALPALEGYLRDAENALLFAPDEPDSLGRAIERLRGDAGLASKLAERAFAEVAKWTWDARARAVLEFAGFEPATRA